MKAYHVTKLVTVWKSAVVYAESEEAAKDIAAVCNLFFHTDREQVDVITAEEFPISDEKGEFNV